MSLTNIQKTLIALAGFVVLGAFTLQWVNAQSPSAQSRRHIPTCSEVGLCNKGERHLLLSTRKNFNSYVVKYASTKGCKTKGLSKSHIRFICPSEVTLPFAHEERVFRLHDLFSNEQIGAAEMQCAGAMGKGIIVAVLDTGADAWHPELQGKIIAQANFTTDAPEDAVGHGTHVAGIIAGQGTRELENANRALGVSPDANLIVGKVCNDQGWCLEGDIQSGIEWAMRQHARVINLSLGGGSFLSHCDDDPLAEEANWAVENGVIVVAAAGNGGMSGEGIATPACGSNVIAVGAVDAADTHTPWSSFGMPLDVVAPGASILSPIPCAVAGVCPDSGYARWSGTSMAAPHVAGAVALLLAQEPSLTPAQIASLLATTAKDLGAVGTDYLYGAGRIAVAAALQKLLANRASHSTSSVSQSSVLSGSSSSENGSSGAWSSSESSAAHESSSTAKEEWRGQTGQPACTLLDWFCHDIGECAPNGKLDRLCELLNARCDNPEAVRPFPSRECDPPRANPHPDDGKREERGPPPHAQNRGHDKKHH